MIEVNKTAGVTEVPMTYEDACILNRGYRNCEVLPGTPRGYPFWNGLLMGLAVYSGKVDFDRILLAQQYRHAEFPVDRGPIVYSLVSGYMCRITNARSIVFGGMHWEIGPARLRTLF